MRNPPSILLLTLAAFASAAGSLSAHTGDRLVPISHLSQESLSRIDLSDGSVEDWEVEVGEPALTLLDFSLVPREGASYDQLDPSNLDFRLWLGWSEDGRIHVAGEFADDSYVNEYQLPSDLFIESDSISLAVDGDHAGIQDTGDLRTWFTFYQRYDAVSRVPAGRTVGMIWVTTGVDEPAGDWMIKPPFASGGGGVFGENPTFWVVEFHATCFDRLDASGPEESTVSRLAEEGVIGFDIYIWDKDEEDTLANAVYALFGGEFGDGVLLGPGGSPGIFDSGGSAVEPASWGRIKTALEVMPPGGTSLPEGN